MMKYEPPVADIPAGKWTIIVKIVSVPDSQPSQLNRERMVHNNQIRNCQEHLGFQIWLSRHKKDGLR
ncbi:hypothetical protein RvVAT039_pl02810 (plasmid) [Agrobacterium vitis]|nr:hypothetical protein RvVAT039_pl02810 [Agrobacterium vitis]